MYKFEQWSSIYSELELGRRIVHMLGLVFPFSYLIVKEWMYVQVILGLAVLIGLIMEYFRLKLNWNNIIYDNLTREYEDEKLAGYYLYIVGMFTVSIIFDPVISIPSMVVLAVGDPIGGMLSDSSVDEKKSLTPFLSVLVFSMIVIFFASSYVYTNVESAFIALIGSLGAALGDYKKIKIGNYVVDDNLIIPILTAVLIYIPTFLLT
jgi:dolichol kinase